ncbi:MAG: malate dehydrogenase (quinone) [Bacteroidetes bacterium]|nr:malate dehydrogenase (quinone) [Bacteroidota bacterium]MBS1941792.1 malate dehydrogenase (quinone) [Bacteroidota bacterium]
MPSPSTETDVALIGCGIMSATLGVMLKELDPGLNLHVFERLEAIAGESSDAWNNAGTGHAGLCELNYTPERADGSIDLAKAVKVDEEFEQSKQFWTWLVLQGRLDPGQFIHSLPHMSFVEGAENRDFLGKRHAAMDAHPLFHGMEFTTERSVIAQWAPLLMKERHDDGIWSATRSMLGTDVDYGALTRLLFNDLERQPGVALHLGHEVADLERLDDGRWRVEVKEMKSGARRVFLAGFVFIGAGGGALPLLEKSKIPEAAGYGGFPVSGEWLRCLNPAVIKQHHAKVYGKAKSGSPPMSVPHLDRRSIGREPALLFGPFAGFSTKFLKHGSWLDLPSSLEWSNLVPMVEAGWKNLDLTKYLIEQVRLKPEERLEELKAFMPSAVMKDWELAIAGQRVQVIKKDPKEGGILEFGTELVAAADGSLAALLGASPGASTAVSIMLGLVPRCFKERAASPAWQDGLRRMVPTFGTHLAADADLIRHVRGRSHKTLGLMPPVHQAERV